MGDTVDEALPVSGRLQGSCHPRFRRVLDAFRRNFVERGEQGASLCISHRGHIVVDLWGGIADPASGRAWERDTISIVFSCTKGAAALVTHMLAERGLLDLHAPVARLWPEFEQAGKAGTTLAMMLGHTAPVPHLRGDILPGAICDWDYMVDRVAAEPAWWPAGTRQGYHGLTFAWTVGQMVRLATGKTLGALFRSEVAEPLGLDFWIGLPESEEQRTAPISRVESGDAKLTDYLRAVTSEPGSLTERFAKNNGRANFNSRAVHAAEISSANGISNARALAGLYAPLASGGGGLVSEETLAIMGRIVAATPRDAVLLQSARFSLGFMGTTDNRTTGGDSAILGEHAFGHVGMGGSVGFADPQAHMSFGYTQVRMSTNTLLTSRGQSLVDSAYAALGWRDSAAGAWRA